MQNYYFDNTHPLHPYTYSMYATPGTFPPLNALRKELPAEKDGIHFGEKDGEWVEIEDHRGKSGYVNDEPFLIQDFGPLPEGWSDTPPLPPPLIVEELFERLRNERNARVTATDKYLLADYPIGAEELGNIRTYRQALRDLPAQEGAPFDGGGDETPWPEKPDV
ncbi:MAG: tail fiber assembly protein [Desulfovibrio sp.]|uniref:tail fiber assembly protein n=1 Tax=Desulfovibrio sp. TaxID=885 RepID=UPI002A3676BA|nr:tail fiber assembly protein [Desulfovibrio sp.]MDY0258514.1 tail fiber assembly protein [Desulfovibrio sp.]